MAGTRSGGIKSRDKILRDNPNFYKEIGTIGGKKSTKGGFAASPERARWAGKIGGTISRRYKDGTKLPDEEIVRIRSAFYGANA